jgi:hypothetical protein
MQTLRWFDAGDFGVGQVSAVSAVFFSCGFVVLGRERLVKRGRGARYGWGLGDFGKLSKVAGFAGGAGIW